MILRELQEKDVCGMLEWMHDPEIQKNFRINMAQKTQDDALAFIREAQTVPKEGESVHFAITNEQGEYLGTISLKNIDLTAQNAEYAICLRRDAQGKGIGAIATKELLYIAFEKYKLERVYLNVLSENINAIRLYEKCGFSYEGEFRKHVFLRGEYKTLKWYSILREEYIMQQRGTGKQEEFV